MKKPVNLIIGALFAATVTMFALTPAVAQDPVKVDAKHYKVELENDRVRVLRVSYGPNEKSVMHQHPEGLIISLTDTQGRFTLPGGKVQDRSSKAGTVTWAPAESHQPENTSGKLYQVILVELKGGAAASMPASAVDAVKADAKHYKVEFENDKVRVLRVRVGPHEKTPMHGHPGNAVIFLTDGHLRFTFPDGKTTESDVKAGQVIWDDPLMHAGENLSDKPFEAIVVELKGN